MTSKILVIIIGFISLVGGSSEYYDSGNYYHQFPAIEKAVQDSHSHAKYSFHYDVHDDHTGDIKSQTETRDGDLVQGEYSLIDSDGYRRIVKYSDEGHGFNVQVIREPTKYQVPQPVRNSGNAAVVSNYASASTEAKHASQNDHYYHVSFNGHGSSYNY